MNNLEITFTVIPIAVAQALTILLTIGRERDIKELRELVNELREHVDEQRLRIVELRAWLAGRNAAQPSRIKAPEPAITPKDLPETIQPRTTEDEAAQAAKSLNWSREIVAGLRAGLKGDTPPEPEIAPNDLPDAIRPSITEAEFERATKAFKLFKADANEASEIVEAREIVADLKGGASPKLAITRVPEPEIAPNDLPDAIRPSITEAEFERVIKAINWFKADANEASEIVEAREIVADLKGVASPKLAITRVPEPEIAPNDLPDAIRPSITEAEFERATKAFKCFKADANETQKIG
jgi:hypothetical protein